MSVPISCTIAVSHVEMASVVSNDIEASKKAFSMLKECSRFFVLW